MAEALKFKSSVRTKCFLPPCHPDWLWGSSIQCLPEALPQEQSGQGEKLTIKLLLPRLQIHGFTHPLPHIPSWYSAQLVKYRKNLLEDNMFEETEKLHYIVIIC
jgi:hypothetical protein